MTLSWHTTMWDVLGVVPFGEDDRAGSRELAVTVGCLIGCLMVIVWRHHRPRYTEDVADALGSVFAVGALASELPGTARLFWVMSAGALSCVGAVPYLHARCVLCAVAGTEGHAHARPTRRRAARGGGG